MSIHLSTYPSSKQKSSAVGSSIVSQPDLDAVVGEFMTVSSTDNHITLDTSIRYLCG